MPRIEEMPSTGEILILNRIGKHSVLITRTAPVFHPQNQSRITRWNIPITNDMIYHSHLWIHDNRILKCHFQSDIFQPDIELTDSQLNHYFGIDLTQIVRNEKLQSILL